MTIVDGLRSDQPLASRDLMDVDDDDVIRFLLGPCDGGEIEADLFGGQLPGSLAIVSKVRVAHYDLDIDAAGLCYRFVGWQTDAETRESRRKRGNPGP